MDRKNPPSIYLKSTDEEKEEFKRVARMYGLSVSELIRRAVEFVAKEQPPLSDVAIPNPN